MCHLNVHVALAMLTLMACRVGEDAASGGRVRSLPRIGLAVMDSASAWCAEFVADSAAPALEAGQPVTLVFAGPSPVASLAGRLGEVRAGECPAEFAQPRWFGYVAYRLQVAPPPLGVAGTIPFPALVVASDAPWERGDDGVVRADLDGDGLREDARRCAADEGEHFTIWSERPGSGRERRWHEYFDWGVLADPTCEPGEDGR